MAATDKLKNQPGYTVRNKAERRRSVRDPPYGKKKKAGNRRKKARAQKKGTCAQKGRRQKKDRRQEKTGRRQKKKKARAHKKDFLRTNRKKSFVYF